MEELEALAPRQFIVPYKGYIVNQEAIRTIERQSIVLKNGVKIPVPRRGGKKLQNEYLDYIFKNNTRGEPLK